jgi:hypothetical protein
MDRLTLISILLFISANMYAQEQASEEARISYYEQRAREDAAYEQSLNLEEEEESDFWNDQERYEKELKKRDKKAYNAYMKGKHDAYAEHYEQCGNHCSHGPHYYSHTTLYYHGYPSQRYNRSPHRTQIRTGVRGISPGIRVGILL